MTDNNTFYISDSLFQDETGLFGDKYYYGDESKDDEDKSVMTTDEFDLLKEDIDLMISTLKDGEKIGYVFDNVNSELYELLTSPEYKDKIELLPGTTA